MIKLETLFRATCLVLPPLEARLLMQHVYDLRHEDFILNSEKWLDETLLKPLVARRLAHEPMAYLLGTQEFYGLEFNVSPATLIPRADSETLITMGLAALKNVKKPRILDLGTGSGALLITLLHLTHGFGVGVDVSRETILIARANARQHNVDAVFMQGDWAMALHGRFDLIISNPPYIETKHMETLQQDVRAFEPHLALDGGADGFACYRLILAQAAPLLTSSGVLLFEIGQGQDTTLKMLASANFRFIAQEKDLNGIIRAVVFMLKE